MQQANIAPFSIFKGQQFLCLTTFRKNGQPVATPVWFGQADDKLYVMTQPTTGKVKRIRHNAQVEVAPCTQIGKLLAPPIEAMAVILTDVSQIETARRTLNHKYGLQKRLSDLMMRMQHVERVYIEITAM
jgi:uncharacterized protein